MTAPIKLAALFAGALLVLAQTSGAAEADGGHKQFQTTKQSQDSRVWEQKKSHKQGKAYGKRGHYDDDAQKHGKKYVKRAQRRYVSTEDGARARSAKRSLYRANYNTNTGIGWRQYQAQRQRFGQNGNGGTAAQRQQVHITQVQNGDQTYLKRSYSNKTLRYRSLDDIDRSTVSCTKTTRVGTANGRAAKLTRRVCTDANGVPFVVAGSTRVVAYLEP